MAHSDNKRTVKKMSDKPTKASTDPLEDQMKFFSSDTIAALVPTRKTVLWSRHNDHKLWGELQKAAENGEHSLKYKNVDHLILHELKELLIDYLEYDCTVDPNKNKDELNISWKSKLADDCLSKKDRPKPATQ